MIKNINLQPLIKSGQSVIEERSRNRKRTVKKLQFRIKDKLGVEFRVDYYKLPLLGISQSLSLSDLRELKRKFRKLIIRAFPNYSHEMTQDLLRKFDRARFVDFVFSDKNELVAFHFYKIETVKLNLLFRSQSPEWKFKVIYVDHTATDPDFEGRGLTTFGRFAVFKYERPDLICGSSANGGIYVAAKRISQQLDLHFYPNSGLTPDFIYKLAQFIHNELGLFNAELDSRLVRTYDGPVSIGSRPHPIENKLHLTSKQHVFYMGFKSEIYLIAKWIWGQSIVYPAIL